MSFVLDGMYVAAETSGETSTYYSRGVNLISRSTGESKDYYYTNSHGDVTKLVNNSGAVVADYTYDAFGNQTSETEDSNPFRYAGEYWDSESGLIYLRARYYDSGVGGFTSADTHWNIGNMIYGDDPDEDNPLPNMNAISQSGNLYVYVMNNPTRYRDFTGNAAIYMNPYMSPDYTFTFVMRETNFWCYNQKYTFTGHIYNQRIGNASKIRFGLYNSSFNGCGWIAVYNTLLNLGGFSHPANIVHELESGALLYGTLGVSPLTVRDYFRNRGYRSVLCINDFDSNAKSGNASILMYAHSEGTHYIAVQWDGSQYRAYNVKNDTYGLVKFDSIEGFLDENGYIGVAVIVVNYQ